MKALRAEDVRRLHGNEAITGAEVVHFRRPWRVREWWDADSASAVAVKLILLLLLNAVVAVFLWRSLT